MILSSCPPGAQIGDVYIPSPLCAFNAAQIQKIIVQRKYSTGVTRNTLTYANAALLASWTTFLTATNSTKVQVSPELANPTLEPGDVEEYGSGNEVPDGVPIITGEGPSNFSGTFLQAHPASITSMRAWQSEDLSVWFINQHGQIICDSDSAQSPTNVYGVKVRSMFVGSRAFGGHTEPDKNSLRLMLPAGWDQNLVLVTPTDFNALIDLSGS